MRVRHDVGASITAVATPDEFPAVIATPAQALGDVVARSSPPLGDSTVAGILLEIVSGPLVRTTTQVCAIGVDALRLSMTAGFLPCESARTRIWPTSGDYGAEPISVLRLELRRDMCHTSV